MDDSCTAGPLSVYLNELIKVCCDAHDEALAYTNDLWTFVVGNWDFFICAGQTAGWGLAIIVGCVVSSLGGWIYYQTSKKRKRVVASTIENEIS